LRYLADASEKRMSIKKQEFYEGAALHLIACSGHVSGIRYDAPFFLFNSRLSVLFKYSTRGRSPWAFTFTADEQSILESRACTSSTAVALICGADGVAAFSYQSYASVAPRKNSAIHFACYRRHNKYYTVNGPDGTLAKKVAPSNWQRILKE